MEPTAVKGEDFPLPGTVSLHSVEVRAGTFCGWGDLPCSDISAPPQFDGGLSLHPPLSPQWTWSLLWLTQRLLMIQVAQKKPEVPANKYFLMERSPVL